MSGVPHHMLDVVHPKKTFTVAEWKFGADKKIIEIISKGKLPILCGGTGFYIQAIVEGLVLPEVPPNTKLRKELTNKSNESLLLILKKLDPERAENIDAKNPVRLIRAIEIAKSLGKVPKITNNNPYKILQIGLDSKDADLKTKIKKRIDSRMKKGMLKESVNLNKNGLSFKRMESLGLEYRLLSELIQNKIDKNEFKLKLENEIWQYVKRQRTWFKRDKKIKWFEPNELRKIEKEINSFLD
jgi:tRNA dimethylallyltransferase